MGSIELLVVGVLGFVRLGWYVFVAVMLWMIWKKVRHLPG